MGDVEYLVHIITSARDTADRRRRKDSEVADAVLKHADVVEHALSGLLGRSNGPSDVDLAASLLTLARFLPIPDGSRDGQRAALGLPGS